MVENRWETTQRAENRVLQIYVRLHLLIVADYRCEYSNHGESFRGGEHF